MAKQSGPDVLLRLMGDASELKKGFEHGAKLDDHEERIRALEAAKP